MTNPLHASLLVGLVLGACRPPLDPPDSVEEMVVFAFREFATEGAVELVANDVHAWTDAHEEDAREGWFVADLTPEDLADVEGVAGPLDGLIGALGLATYRSDLDPVLEAITSPDKATIYEKTESLTVLSEEGDRACFLSRACDRYVWTTEETTRIAVIGRSTRRTVNELRWITIDGVQHAVMRQVSPEGVTFHADVPLMAIDQQYGVVLLRPVDGGGVRRVEAFWVEARVIGAELPEGFAVRLTVDQFQKAADDIDAYVLGEDGSGAGAD